jgi:Protein of unknown function (DUF2867)
VPWRIHGIAPEFRVEDVWELPFCGNEGDFRSLVAMIASGDPSRSSSRAARGLFAIRWGLGRLLGWDKPAETKTTLSDRLPADLRSRPGPDFKQLPFISLYLLEDEWAAEVANRTVHAVMHIGWVKHGNGGGRGQMAILVKPNGRLGTAYMAAIRPFRRLIVYPALLREWRNATTTRGEVKPCTNSEPRSKHATSTPS